jgi:Ca2+-binding EF-hand superfamily protein
MVRSIVIVVTLLLAPAVASAQQQRCTSDANQVIAQIYQQVLERAPDPDASGQVRRLENGDVTVRQIVADLAKSAEHTRRFLAQTDTQAQKEAAINYLYKHLLGRSGDPGGVRNYVARAQQRGLPAVIDEIMASPEYAEWSGDNGVPGTSVRWCGKGNAQTSAATPPPNQVQMRFRGMDLNNDGQIARDEWRGSAQSFRVHDWNRDGVLSGVEVRPGGRQPAAAAAERDFGNTWSDEDFTALDRNRDGRIASTEWYFDAESFRRADRNRDGVLTRAEYLGNAAADDDREDQFDFLDANGNGRLERGEWHGSRDAFEWLDRNNDNLLSRAEVAGADDTTAPNGFANIDANGDGRIQVAEWRWSRRSFNAYDTNSDGVLTRIEFRSGGGAPTASRQQ